jgi:hypothetical protein
MVIFNPFIPGNLDFTGAGGGGGGGGPAERFTQTFNATTDWGSPSGGFYTISVSAASHGKGATPMIGIYELVAAQYQLVTVDQAQMDGSGNISFRVTDSPDLRFAGLVLII